MNNEFPVFFVNRTLVLFFVSIFWFAPICICVRCARVSLIHFLLPVQLETKVFYFLDSQTQVENMPSPVPVQDARGNIIFLERQRELMNNLRALLPSPFVEQNACVYFIGSSIQLDCKNKLYCIDSKKHNLEYSRDFYFYEYT